MEDLLRQLLTDNQFFQGGLLLGAFGIILAYARRIPNMLMHIGQRLWTVSVVVRDQQLIEWINHWLAISEYGQRNRWFTAHAMYLDGSNLTPVLGPGYGLHRFMHGGTVVWFKHELEDQGVKGQTSLIRIRTLGRSQDAVRGLLNEAAGLANQKQSNRTPIFINSDEGYWHRLSHVSKRSKDSVYLRAGLMDFILKDALDFIDRRGWYDERGIPHRRGYLLHGPPGNGKTTVIRAIANELNMPIYALVLSGEEMTDSVLATTIGRIPDPCIVVLEDFEKLSLENTNITMSGMLNAIDGPLASEGRILIMTANDISDFHPSMLRSGRIDQQWEIGNPDEHTIESYVTKLFPHQENGFVKEAHEEGWSMADLQSKLISTIPKQ